MIALINNTNSLCWHHAAAGTTLPPAFPVFNKHAKTYHFNQHTLHNSIVFVALLSAVEFVAFKIIVSITSTNDVLL